MGLFSAIGDVFGEVTGLGSNGNPDPHNMDPTVYAELYNDALGQINRAGQEQPEDRAFLANIKSSASTMLDGLKDNAAGRKKNFEEDMTRSYGADVQNMARAKGGTGGLANALHNEGNLYDSQARGLSRGYNDLYGQAVDDLGQIQGVQSNLFNQDLNKANAAAGVRMNELSSRRGTGMQNLENTFNSEQAGRERRLNTLGGIAKGVGGMFGGGK